MCGAREDSRRGPVGGGKALARCVLKLRPRPGERGDGPYGGTSQQEEAVSGSEQVENVSGAAKPAAQPFVQTLVGIIRAEDSYGAWDKKSDLQLLKDFIVTKEERRAIPIIGDPDPEALHRVEQYYRAVGLRIEQRTGLMASPMMKMSHEGFGRVILTTGKLVAFAKTLRDVHRFGFEDLVALDREGEKVVDQAVKSIEEFPQVARD
jgi:probable nitrogen fixation protein